MPICPNCNQEIKLKITMIPAEKDEAMIEMQKKSMDAIQNMGGMMGKMMKKAQKMAGKMAEKMGGSLGDQTKVPINVVYCNNCGYIFITEIYKPPSVEAPSGPTGPSGPSGPTGPIGSRGGGSGFGPGPY